MAAPFTLPKNAQSFSAWSAAKLSTARAVPKSDADVLSMTAGPARRKVPTTLKSSRFSNTNSRKPIPRRMPPHWHEIW